MFLKAEELLEAERRGERARRQNEAYFDKLLRMSITRDERVLRLAKEYFTMEDILEIRLRQQPVWTSANSFLFFARHANFTAE